MHETLRVNLSVRLTLRLSVGPVVEIQAKKLLSLYDYTCQTARDGLTCHFSTQTVVLSPQCSVIAPLQSQLIFRDS